MSEPLTSSEIAPAAGEAAANGPISATLSDVVPKAALNMIRALFGSLRSNLEHCILKTDDVRQIADSALDRLKAAVESGKVVAEWTGDLARDIARDPKLHAIAINFIVQGLTEAGYLYGGRAGGRAMERIAEKLAERALTAVRIEVQPQPDAELAPIKPDTELVATGIEPPNELTR